MSHAIEARDVHKIYRRFSRRRQFATLKSALLARSLLRDLRPDESFEALRGVSFDVASGRTFGVIGRNGSGKSTLLKLVAGIGKPTSGTVRTTGRISALIELGAGFHPEISGRENVFINGLMLGMPRREIARRFDEIVSFAELEPFIDAPVKTYSSGMYMRLGFSVALHVNPDVLLVDEVLAVGDEAFTHRCFDKFAEFKRLGKTILLVTHSLDVVERFCDEALWLDAGRVRGQGDPRRIVAEYRLDVARQENDILATGNTQAVETGGGQPRETPAELTSAPGAASAPEESDEPADMFRAAEGRWGSREVEISDVVLADGAGAPTCVFESGTPMEVRLVALAHQPVADLVFGVAIFNAEGVCCYGTNTQIDGVDCGELRSRVTVRFLISSLELVAGSYRLDVAVHRRNGVPYDYHRLLYSFRVTSPHNESGVIRLRHQWAFAARDEAAGGAS
jgi:ABC-type polysaccharide/polyol phosphate transport system ATPase subunit